MKKENFYKANINEAELNEFLESLAQNEQKRFLKILDNEKFFVPQGRIIAQRFYPDADTVFFCGTIRKFEQRESLFKDKKANEIIDDFSYKYNMSLYEDDAYERIQKNILHARMRVWSEYADFLQILRRWYSVSWYSVTKIEQNKLLEKIGGICAEFESKDDLSYVKVAYAPGKGRLIIRNDERVDVIALITRAKDALSELKKFIKKNILSEAKGHLSKETPVSEIEKFLKENSHSEVNDLLASHSEVSDLLKKAEKLLKNNQENEIFINNDVSFKYLFDNNLIYRFCGIEL